MKRLPGSVKKLERPKDKERMMVRLDEENTSGALAYVTGMVNQQLLLQNEYVLTENRILRAQVPNRLLLTDPERSTLAIIGKQLGRRGLEPVASAARADILAWFRKLVA